MLEIELSLVLDDDLASDGTPEGKMEASDLFLISLNLEPPEDAPVIWEESCDEFEYTSELLEFELRFKL
jgi:hypothetical protein